MSEKKEALEVEVINNDVFENVDVICDDLSIHDSKEITLRDINYMCKYISEYEGCENCILNDSKSYSCPFIDMVEPFGGYKALNSSIKKWLMDNPPKSFLMDIKQKMPNADLDEEYHIPKFCVKNIYGKDCIQCEAANKDCFDAKDMYCRKCWRTPIEKVE